MRITSKLCKSMNKINEDVVCGGDNYAFVLDGQSQEAEGSRITRWYVKQLRRELKKNMDGKTLLDVLNKSIKKTLNQIKSVFPNEEIPGVSACILRRNGEKIEVLIVGNAKCLIQSKKIELVEDPIMDRVENNILRKMTMLKNQKNINMLEAKKEIHNLLTETRKKVYDMGCYPIIKDKKLEMTDIVYKEYAYSDVISAVICTDGFYNYKTYLKIKDKDLYDVINNQGLTQCYKHIRRIEENDASLNSFPRLSLYDDASALHIVFY